MSDKASDYEKVYLDTLYFVDAMIEEYGFYSDVFKMVKRGNATIEIKKKHLVKTVDEAWISAIETAMPSLDRVIRLPRVEIEENEEVLPVELSHHITARSVKYLAQHTDMINKIEDGEVIPSKLLNVFYDETTMTYENKFINTLIQRLYYFVSKRYIELLENSANENCSAVEFKTSFMSEQVRGKCSFNIELSESDGAEANAIEHSSRDQLERIKRINTIISAYQSGEFSQAMGKNYVHPPIMRTNIISKNPDYFACLQLWEFIESYENVGYEIRVEETAEKPQDEYIKQLYSMMALQYVVFRYNVSPGANKELTLDSRTADSPLRPRVITDFQELDADDYSVYDSRYRKMVPISQLSTRKRLSADEKKIRDAIDVALAADRAMEQAIIDERNRLRAEAAQEKRAQAARIRQEKAEKRAAEKERKQLEKQLLKKHKKPAVTEP